jgi:hypothetical protein
MLLSGLLAGFSVVVEYQTAVISAALGAYACVAVRKTGAIASFVLGGLLTGSLLAAYNYAAFGDPLDFGYAHEVSREFRAVHSAQNPLGLRIPALATFANVVPEILWKPFRGLLFYAPILCAAPVGFVALIRHQRWGVALVCVAAFAWLMLVNVSYPKWEGGWCTGPRFMVPAIPFTLLLVGGLVSSVKKAGMIAFLGSATIAGAILMLGCVAVGGRFPPDAVGVPPPMASRIANPVREIVLPHWRGRVQQKADPLPKDMSARGPAYAICPMCQRHPPSYLAGGRQFERNVGRWLVQRFVPAEPSPWQGLQMGPLLAYLVAMTAALLIRAGRAAQRT